MKTIWKFPLKLTDAQVVEIPLPAEVLTVQSQGDGVCLWAEVDPKSEKVRISIVILGTGHPMPDVPLRYISTIQLGSLVFHAYEAR